MSNEVINGVIGRIRNGKNGMTINWIFMVLVMIVVTAISYADWRASVHGFEQLPINSITPWLAEVVGLLPQITQGIAFMFAAGSFAIGSRWWIAYTFLWFVAFSFDVMTDYVFFITDPPTMESKLVAAAMSIFIFTLFSEWILAITVPVVFGLMPEVVPKIIKGFLNLIDGITNVDTKNRNNTGGSSSSNHSSNVRIRPSRPTLPD